MSTPDSKKAIELARKAIELKVPLDKIKEAWALAKEIDPNNGEALINWHWINIIADDSDNWIEDYNALCEDVPKGIKMIANSDDSEEEKKDALMSACGSIATLTMKLDDTLFDLLHNEVIDFSTYSDIRRTFWKGVDLTKDAGDLVIEIFGDKDVTYTLVACLLWKEAIALQHHFNSGQKSFKDRKKIMWWDEYAEKIKKYEPDYVMPKFKQEGCISFK